MPLPIDEESRTDSAIDLAKAAKIAMDFVRRLGEEGLIRGPLVDLIMEEVVRSNDGNWDITIGWRGASLLDPDAGGQWKALLGEPRRPSQYFRVVTVSAHDGTVLAVKIRGSE